MLGMLTSLEFLYKISAFVVRKKEEGIGLDCSSLMRVAVADRCIIVVMSFHARVRL